MANLKDFVDTSARLRFILVVVILGIGLVTSDFAEDQKECRDQLQMLSPCLSFVTGQFKSPSSSCCTQLRNNANKSKKCLCVLVKDRSEPGLGFKLNSTLALSLPALCHTPNKASDCPGLLQLAPNSTEAQVFEQFAASHEGNITATDSPTVTSSSSSQRIWLEGVFFWIGITVYITIAA